MRYTILLADDSSTIQRLVVQTFADTDFNIVSVSNGELAIRRLEDVRPDLILADVYMPGKSGYEVCAYVRAHPSFSATPVILLVGAFDAYDEETALQAGASGSITKPFEAQVLVDLAVSLLARGHRDAAMDEDTVEAPTIIGSRIVDEGDDESQTVAIPSTTSPAPAPASVQGDVPRNKEMAEPPHPEESDLLGLESLFRADPPSPGTELSDADIERIADRVMQKLSVQAIESVAWDIVPDIVDKILRDSPKRV